jgi:hypothetical protein
VYRLLLPLWRTDPLYHELRESHSSYEAQHDWWRDRYKVAVDDLGVRPKIREIGWHRLRANVAALVDWLRICYREGWLGKSRRNHLGTERKFKDRAAISRVKLAKMRVRMGIVAAYGDKAEQLGLGNRIPRDGVAARPARSRPVHRTEPIRRPRMSPGRLLCFRPACRPGGPQFRSKVAANTPQSRPLTPKDAPAPYLETEASN